MTEENSDEEDNKWRKLAEDLYKKHGVDQHAIEWRFGEAVAIHHIAVPSIGDKGYYREVISMDYYRGRELEKVYGEKARKKGMRLANFPVQYAMRRRDDWEFSQESSRDSIERITGRVYDRWSNLPVHEHASIWDFYKFIGYDYKKQKYLNEAENYK